MPDPRFFKALCALVCAMALAGFAACGGDDEEKSAGGDTEQTTTGQTTTEGASAGGGEGAEYIKEFRAAGEDFRDAAQASAAKVASAPDTEGRVQALEDLKGVVTDAADDFEALDPPADAQAAHDKLVSQFRDVADEVETVSNALESGDQAAAEAGAQKLQQAQAAITETLTSIESKVQR